jgi:hypothetical protein
MKVILQILLASVIAGCGSLPSLENRSTSKAPVDTDETRLGRGIAPRVAAESRFIAPPGAAMFPPLAPPGAAMFPPIAEPPRAIALSRIAGLGHGIFMVSCIIARWARGAA